MWRPVCPTCFSCRPWPQVLSRRSHRPWMSVFSCSPVMLASPWPSSTLSFPILSINICLVYSPKEQCYPRTSAVTTKVRAHLQTTLAQKPVDKSSVSLAGGLRRRVQQLRLAEVLPRKRKLLEQRKKANASCILSAASFNVGFGSLIPVCARCPTQGDQLISWTRTCVML